MKKAAASYATSVVGGTGLAMMVVGAQREQPAPLVAMGLGLLAVATAVHVLFIAPLFRK